MAFITESLLKAVYASTECRRYGCAIGLRLQGVEQERLGVSHRPTNFHAAARQHDMIIP
jgi:hypothetical protein